MSTGSRTQLAGAEDKLSGGREMSNACVERDLKEGNRELDSPPPGSEKRKTDSPEIRPRQKQPPLYRRSKGYRGEKIRGA